MKAVLAKIGIEIIAKWQLLQMFAEHNKETDSPNGQFFLFGDGSF